MAVRRVILFMSDKLLSGALRWWSDPRYSSTARRSIARCLSCSVGNEYRRLIREWRDFLPAGSSALMLV